jgi:hypothetical protein
MPANTIQSTSTVAEVKTYKTGSEPNAYNAGAVPDAYSRAYQPWTDEEDQRLQERYNLGLGIQELAVEFQRKPGGIRARLKRLGLMD